MRIATERGFLQPSTKVILSSPILRSSTSLAWPRSLAVNSSSFVITFPPVALASFSMSDFLARRIAKIPPRARKCCARSSMPFWQMNTLAPDLTTFLTMSRSIFSSCFMKASICSGRSMFSFASNSVFSISNEEFNRAIFAFSMRFGIPG